MTEPEQNAELLKRLRKSLRLFQGDCSDRELIRFAKRVHPVTYACILLRMMLENIGLKWHELFYYPFQDHSEAKYRALYHTLLAENACLTRKEAALRGENKALREKCRENDRNATSEG